MFIPTLQKIWAKVFLTWFPVKVLVKKVARVNYKVAAALGRSIQANGRGQTT